MSVALKNSFFQNARGLTFKDTASVVWAISPNTNEVTAVTGGTVGSVGLSDGSTAPIYTISNSPVTGSGTLTFTLKSQNANVVLAGPGSGAAAQPVFRALVVGDLPTGYPYANLSGSPSLPAGANPTAKVGLAVVNGTAAGFMRSDGSPPLDVAISPTWTGVHTFSPASGNAIIANGVANSYTCQFIAPNSAGQSFGVIIQAGTNSSDTAFIVQSAAGSQYLKIRGDGQVFIGGRLAINGGTPTAALAGFGSPSGTVTSGLNSSSTLVQVAGTLAALCAYLKTIGFITT